MNPTAIADHTPDTKMPYNSSAAVEQDVTDQTSM